MTAPQQRAGAGALATLAALALAWGCNWPFMKIVFAEFPVWTFRGASGLTAGLAGQTPQSFYDAGTDSTYLGYYVTAVPEPGSFALAACGMALAGWSIARRRTRAAR